MISSYTTTIPSTASSPLVLRSMRSALPILVLLCMTFLSVMAKATPLNNAPSSTSSLQSIPPNQRPLKGIITAITPDSLTITNKMNSTSQTFALSPDTQISKSCNCDGSLQDLSVGQRVRVQVSPDGVNATRIYIKNQQGGSKTKEKHCGCASDKRQNNQ